MSDYPAWFIDNPFFDLEEITTDISDSNKKGLMVLFTTKGCSYCEQFIKRSLGNPEIAKKVQNDFDSIGMEIFDDAEMVTPTGETIPVKQFAKQQGVGFAPTLLFFDAAGKTRFATSRISSATAVSAFDGLCCGKTLHPN